MDAYLRLRDAQESMYIQELMKISVHAKDADSAGL